MYPSIEELESLAGRNDFVWHQRFDLGSGVMTPGANDIGWLLQKAGVPEDLSGKSVLDIGTTNGGAAFLAERRGAYRVVAVDIYDDEWFGFRAIKEALRSRVEFKRSSIYELPTLLQTQFDYVFFFEVIYHLRHPLLALDNVRLLTRQTAWIEGAIADAELGDKAGDAVAYYFRANEYKSDATNWFLPSISCLTDWCLSSGLKPTRVASWPDSAPERVVIQVDVAEPEYLDCSYELPLTVVVEKAVRGKQESVSRLPVSRPDEQTYRPPCEGPGEQFRTQRRSAHFVIIGDVGGKETYHVGDEAMLEANLECLRAHIPDVSFTTVSADPDWTASLYGVGSVLPLGFPTNQSGWAGSYDALLAWAIQCAEGVNGLVRAADAENNVGLETSAVPEGFTERCSTLLQELKSSDGLVISGGGNLCSSWPHLFYERVALISMAQRLGKRVVVLGQTLGPHLTPPEYRLLAEALCSTDLVVVREYPSYDLAAAMGVPSERLLYALDDAFLMSSQPANIPGPVGDLIGSQQEWIAVTFAAFVDPRGGPPEIKLLADQLAQVQEHTGAALVFIPHAGAAHGSFADETVASALAEHLGSSFFVLNLRLAAEVRWITQRASMVISNRYHPLVFGSSGQVPCLGLYSDHYTEVKILGILDHVGLRDWGLSIQSALEGELAARSIDLWSRRKQIRALLAANAQQRQWHHEERTRKILAAL